MCWDSAPPHSPPSPHACTGRDIGHRCHFASHHSPYPPTTLTLALVLLQAGTSVLNYYFEESTDNDESDAQDARSEYLVLTRTATKVLETSDTKDAAALEEEATLVAVCVEGLTSYSPATLSSTGQDTVLNLLDRVANTSVALGAVSTTAATSTVKAISNVVEAGALLPSSNMSEAEKGQATFVERMSSILTQMNEVRDLAPSALGLIKAIRRRFIVTSPHHTTPHHHLTTPPHHTKSPHQAVTSAMVPGESAVKASGEHVGMTNLVVSATAVADDGIILPAQAENNVVS